MSFLGVASRAACFTAISLVLVLVSAVAASGPSTANPAHAGVVDGFTYDARLDAAISQGFEAVASMGPAGDSKRSAHTAIDVVGHVYNPSASFVAPRGADAATDIVRYDPDFAIGQIASGGNASASDLVEFGTSQGWQRTQTATGSIKFVDDNGVTRLTIKSGSPREPGSGSPHIEIRNAAGQRIDVYGNPVTRRSPRNHTPIIWDLGS